VFGRQHPFPSSGKERGNTHLIWPIKQSYSTLLGTVVSVGPYVISASQIIYLKTGANPVVLITLQMQDDGQKSEERNNPNVIYHYENPKKLI